MPFSCMLHLLKAASGSLTDIHVYVFHLDFSGGTNLAVSVYINVYGSAIFISYICPIFQTDTSVPVAQREGDHTNIYKDVITHTNTYKDLEL